MQISGVSVFVFVEGRRDRFFFGGICDATFRPQSIKYEIRSSMEIVGKQGKDGLLTFFFALSAKNKLCHDFKGKKTAVAVCLDKDIDDLKGALHSSAHLIYTQFYSVENHLICHGDLHRAASAAGSVDPALLVSRFSNPAGWMREAASHWRQWVALCVASGLNDVRCDATYRSTSRVNVGGRGGFLPQQYSERVTKLQAALGQAKKTGASVNEVVATVEELYRSGSHDVAFSGAWYSVFALEDLKALPLVDGIDATSFDSRFWDAMQATIDFAGDWTVYFRDRFLAMADCVPA
jgi:hypothetical protein